MGKKKKKKKNDKNQGSPQNKDDSSSEEETEEGSDEGEAVETTGEAKKEEAKTEVKAEAKKEEAKTEVKAEAKKEEAKTEVKAEAKKEEAKTEVKAEAKKEEVKTEAKTESPAPAVPAKPLEVGKALSSKFGESILQCQIKNKQETITLQKDKIIPVLEFLKSDPELSFNYLTDITALDCLLLKGATKRFAVVYHLYSFKNNVWIRLKAFLAEGEEVDTAVPLWLGANWMEREVFDMFGISFRGHPDLRKLLMPEDYPGHPLRKDYPLQGRGERDNFPRITN